MNREILRFVDTIHRDKQIDKELIFKGVELALVSAAMKRYGSGEDIVVVIDRESGAIEATVDGEPLSPEDLGRIAALSGKQVLFQKIREAEREVIYEEYKPKVGQLLTGTVQSRKPGGVLILSLGGAEGFMPRSEQSPAENFNEGDRIKVVLSEVNLMPNRVQLLCSRSSPDLVRRLFELEIPEVAEYVVEIKAVAREPGYRTKIAVTTFDPNVDCVGACVGVKGSRIRNIVDELFGEKIDIVRWNDSIEVLIVEGLRPAEIASLDLDFETKSAIVYVKPDQQSLAIGRRGQNVRLASKLTGWELKITPVSDEDLEKMREEGMETIADGMFNESVATAEAEPSPEMASKLDKLFQGEAAAESAEESEAPPPSTAAQSAMAALFVTPESEGGAAALEAGEEVAVADDGTEDDGAEDDGAEDEGAEDDGEEEPAGSDATEEQRALISSAIADAVMASSEPDPVVVSDGNGGEPDGVDSSGNGVDGAALVLEELPGVGAVTATRLREAGLDSRDKILEVGAESLASVEGISESKAQKIIEYLSS